MLPRTSHLQRGGGVVVARGVQPVRQWRLLLLLASRGGRTIPEIQAEMGCSRRTVWRDLEVLQEVGFPITAERDGRESRYRLIEGARGLPPIPLSLPELASLHLARHLLAPLQRTPFGEPIETALQKITATLTPAAKAFLDHLPQELSARMPHGKDCARSGHLVRSLQDAIGRRLTVEGEYHSFGRNAVSLRRLNPLHLWIQQGGIYLAAFCHRRQEVRTFAVERFRSLRLSESHFEPPPDFNLEQYLEWSFGLFRGTPIRIRLRFTREVARYVAEREWHPTQTLVPLLTGELEFDLRAPLCPDLIRWILGYGKDVEVLEPKALRDQIRREWLAALRGPGGRAEPTPGVEGRARRKPRLAAGTTLVATGSGSSQRSGGRVAGRR